VDESEFARRQRRGVAEPLEGDEPYGRERDLGGGIIASFNGREVRLQRRLLNKSATPQVVYLDRVDALELRRYIEQVVVPNAVASERWVF
jgi:hypothetical protein